MGRSDRIELVDIVPAGNTLGEGILWDAEHGRAWWTDIQERRLFRYDPLSRQTESFALPERLGSFGLVDGSDRIVAAFESGFAFFHAETGACEWIARPAHAAANIRFNDGRVDRQGRFWAGSMVEGNGPHKGKLYRLEHGKAPVICLEDIAISNSLCFSPDGATLYFADTPQRRILRYDLDRASGAISNPRVFAETPEGAFPDGSNVDSEGCVWNAHWGAGRVVCYAPDGSVRATIDIPARQPTCVAFGGRDLDLLFVTSAREGLGPTPAQHAGDVFIYKTPAHGLPEPQFRVLHA
ncbi:MAG TPA: SMP-30/gluconolactonase/LRE family protein [Rhizomicrobium sp.]|jgi:sugar lactone lactonase YvrE